MKKANTLPEEFKTWLEETFKEPDWENEDAENNYKLIDQFSMLDSGYKNNSIVADRLKYITVIYDSRLPHDGGTDYRVIFEDLKNPGDYYCLHSYMNSWFEFEQWDMVCDTSRWSKVHKVSKVIETFEEF